MHSYRVKYGTREGWGVMETNQFFSVGDPFPDRFGRWVVSKMLDDPTDAYVCSLILAALPRSDEPVIRLDIRLEDLRTSDLDPEKGYIELTPSEAESLRNRLADTLSTLLEDQADGQHQ